MDAARGVFLLGDIVSAWHSGLRAAAGNARLLGWLLAGNLALAALAVGPLMGPFEESLSHHEAASEMTRRFDMSWWVDLTTSRAEAFARALDGIAVAAFLSAVMGCFFAGGLLQAYQDTLAGLGMDRFMTSCRKWFPRFAWLFVLSLPFYWIAHRVVDRAVAAWLDNLFEHVEDERVGLALSLARASAFLILFDMVTLVSDYARVHAVVRSERSMLASLVSGIRFVLRHPVAVGSLELRALGMQVLGLALYLPFDAVLARDSAGSLVAGLAAGQLYVLLRLFLRESSRAGQLALYRAGLRDST